VTPFDDNRTVLIVSDYSLTIPWVNIPPYFTDVALPAHDPKTTKAVYDQAVADGKIRGTRVQLWYDATHGEAGNLVAQKISRVIADTGHNGGVEVNFENGNDGELANELGAFYPAFRAIRPTRPVGINLAPFKAYVFPIAAAKGDPFCHVRVQNFYGNEMRQADSDELKRDFCDAPRSWPEERFSFCYSAKAHTYADGHVECDLPVFADAGAYVRRLRKGSVFNLNLMREAQLL
jgi:hypothetical protein